MKASKPTDNHSSLTVLETADRHSLREAMIRVLERRVAADGRGSEVCGDNRPNPALSPGR